MMTIEHTLTKIFDLAAKACGAWRDFENAAAAARADVPADVLSDLDDTLDALPAEIFAARVLAHADTLLIRLHAAADQAGGAPDYFYTQDGAAHLVSGTDAGGRIAGAADKLAEFLTLAWRVADMLTAEAAITAQRAALEARCTGAAAPETDPDQDPDSPA